MKRCKTCQVEKPEEDFGWQYKARGKRQPMCKLCHAAYQRRYREERREYALRSQRKSYATHREAILQQKKQQYDADPERIRARNRARYARDKASGKAQVNSTKYRLSSRFGLSVADFERMTAEQGGRCAICQREKKLCVDHCHTTGKVRGLLCRACNSYLGNIQDSLEALERARLYLLQATEPHS